MFAETPHFPGRTTPLAKNGSLARRYYATSAEGLTHLYVAERAAV